MTYLSHTTLITYAVEKVRCHNMRQIQNDYIRLQYRCIESTRSFTFSYSCLVTEALRGYSLIHITAQMAN